MRKVSKIFLYVGIALSAIATLVFIIMTVCSFTGGLNDVYDALLDPTYPADRAEAIQYLAITYAVMYIIFAVFTVVGIFVGLKALSKFETSDMSIKYGVLLIIFTFVPSGVLYLIYRGMYLNSKAVSNEVL